MKHRDPSTRFTQNGKKKKNLFVHEIYMVPAITCIYILIKQFLIKEDELREMSNL